MDENQLECQECRQSYGSGERCPRSLFCGHTFCTKCLDRAIVSGRRRCSSCGRPFIATSAAQLPTDYALLRRCSARADDAGSLKTPGTPAYNLKLQNADSSSSTRHSSGASSHDSRFVNSASSSSNMQTLSASNHDDSKSLSSTSSSSLPTYNTSGFPSKSSSTDSSPFDLQTYSSRLLSATEYSQKDLSSGAPQITKNYFFPPIDTVTITTSSLTPRFSSAPAVTRSLSSPSDSRLGSSFLEKEKFCDNAIVNRDETDSPRSSVLMRILNKEEPSSRPPALTYKFPTIRTRFSIGNRESKASLESNNDDVRSSEEGVRSLHGELKKKRSSPLTTSELSFKNSAKTEAEQSYVVSSHSRHNTSRSDSLTKMHPELKCTPAKDISSVRLPLTSRVSKIANQDQRLADSKTIEQPDSAISCPVSSAQPDSEVSITSQGSVPSLSKFNAKLHAPSEEKQAQIREDNISASDRQLGSDNFSAGKPKQRSRKTQRYRFQYSESCVEYVSLYNNKVSSTVSS
nr:uncharacterized protein LOC128690405 [Cherax quadricarinatus]